MAPRAMATGTISFGLVSIPVKLYSASENSKAISFNMLHKKCGGRVKMQYYCPADDEVVSRNELGKGYEFAKDQYVLFTDEELKALETKPTQSIDIAEFLPAEAVDPVYYDKAYYLGPGKGGDRPYRLLAEAMRETGRVALANYAVRGTMYLVLLRPYENGLVMQQLHWADEVRSFSEVPVGEAELKDTERNLARQLVEQIARDDFDPASYEDEGRKQLWALIEQKVAGKEITAAPVEEPRGQIIDLMEALKASLAASGPEGKEARKPPKRAAATAKGAAKKAAAGRSRAARK